jgi:hypothetical protein
MRRLAVVALLMELAVPVGGADIRDKFDGYFEKAKASGYRNCGSVFSLDGTNREAVDACVLEAFLHRQAFFARYDQMGIDSAVAEGLLFSQQKVLTVVHFDGWGCATPNCAYPETCNSPRITKTKKGIRVRCTTDYDL